MPWVGRCVSRETLHTVGSTLQGQIKSLGGRVDSVEQAVTLPPASSSSLASHGNLGATLLALAAGRTAVDADFESSSVNSPGSSGGLGGGSEEEGEAPLPIGLFALATARALSRLEEKVAGKADRTSLVGLGEALQGAVDAHANKAAAELATKVRGVR